MLQLVKVLIGRSALALERPFSYWYESEKPLKPLTRVFVDFAHSQDQVGFVCEEPEPLGCTVEEYREKTGIRLAPIKGVIDSEPILTDSLKSLAEAVSKHYLCPLISVYQTMLPPSLKPSQASLNGPKEKWIKKAFATDSDPLILDKNQQKLYDRIRSCADGMKLTAQTAKTASFQALLSQGLVAVKTERVDRIKEREETEVAVEATPEQQKALNDILSSDKPTVLLEGVTGSGKSLVYLKAAQKMMEQGKGTIVLVPEIALTDRLAAMFKGTFHDEVAILHSELTNANRYDEYLRIKEGKAKVVVGTRSAVFAPVANLGLICIDEEHSSSYKQDSTPYYDARTVAQMRSSIEGAKVVLGSATPAVEDKARAEYGLFGYASLPNRVAAAQKVEFSFVDMSVLDNLSMVSSLLSNPLIESLKKVVGNQEQAIIFLNRRGYSPLVQCRECNTVQLCPNCEIPFTFHRRDFTLRCHRCETVVRYQDAICSKCGKKNFITLGFGTERIQDDLAKVIPGIRVERLDRDNLTEGKRVQILKDFRERKFDVLVGTQMVVKGHDFPKVTLAAALSADQSLAYPSYMAGEVTFDLICQLVGRSGRADIPGKALIQTYNPFNTILQLAARQDYEGFYRYEIANRKRFLFPPYCLLCDIIVSGKDSGKVLDRCYGIKSFLAEKLRGKRANIYGPSDLLFGKLNERYFKKIMIKYKDSGLVLPVLEELKSAFLADKSGLEMSINIDSRGE